jgi:hypothetical protein
MEQAKKWIEELKASVETGKIGQLTAYKEVFAEMEEGDHDHEVETLFYNYTQGLD